MARPRRFLRNETEFRLTSPKHEPLEDWSLSGLTVIGIVCNPKTNEPALVVTDGEYVSLRGLTERELLKRLGRGYYEESVNEPSQATSLPRVHTPEGVVVKGQGWGTTLYTALCVGAHLADLGIVEVAMWKKGDGVCSWTANRSAEADRWWAAALKMGLCEQQHEEESETEEHVELDLSPSDLDEFVEEGEVTYVNKVDVDIEKKTEIDIEYYSYEKASDDHHLVAAALNVEVPKGLSGDQSLTYLWTAMREDSDLVPEADPHALLGLDVRNLSRASLRIIALCFSESGLGGKEVDELFLRYTRGLDPGVESGQARLFPNQSGLGDVLLARESAGWPDLGRLP